MNCPNPVCQNTNFNLVETYIDGEDYIAIICCSCGRTVGAIPDPQPLLNKIKELENKIENLENRVSNLEE